MAQAPQRALVTGASSGIGAAVARRLAARGIEVWLAARRAERLADEVRAIEKAGGRAHAVSLDVSDLDATAAALTKLDEDTGGIDLVVANAGVGGANALSTSSWAEVRDVFQVNLMGAAATVVPFIPRMVARGRGHLVGISSIAADVPLARGAAYGAGKAGLTFFLESARIELKPLGVDITIVHPGFIRTPLNEGFHDQLPLLMELDQAAGIIDRGIARRARMVRFPWLMGAMARFANSLPRAMMEPLLRAASSRELPARTPPK